MRDAIELEWEGIPTVAVIADALVGSAEAMKRLTGMHDYPYVVVPYPVGTLTPGEVTALAETIAPAIVRLLTTERGTGGPDVERPEGSGR